MGVSTKVSELRRYRRAPVSTRVSMECLGVESITRTIDLGAGGMRVTVTTPYPIGCQINITLCCAEVHCAEPVELTGKVVHVDGSSMGVKFDTLSPAALAVVLALVAKQFKEVG